MKSKLITTMMTALFLAFAVIALPLLSVPTVSASTLKFKYGEWCSDGNAYPTIYPPGQSGVQPMLEGPLTGDISATIYAWSTPETGTVGPHLKPEPSATFHWHQDILCVFGDSGWIIGWIDGAWPTANKPSPNTAWTSFEGRITDASPDKKNYIGCKISGKGYSIWWPDPLPNGLSLPSGLPQWGGVDGESPGTWGYAEGTLSISGSLNK